LIQHYFLLKFGSIRGSSTLLVIFYPSQTKHAGTNVVSLLKAAMALVPKGLTGEIKPRIIQTQVWSQSVFSLH